jgi:hypothetical protein
MDWKDRMREVETPRKLSDQNTVFTSPLPETTHWMSMKGDLGVVDSVMTLAGYVPWSSY